MKYAIVESGGKQYKAVEGGTIDVDRLPVEVGAQVDLPLVLMTVDGDDVSVGTPTLSGIQVSTTVLDHFKGPKVTVFKYSPKKRIRVRSGHRQQYTRLSVEAIGIPGERVKAAGAGSAAKAPSGRTRKDSAGARKAAASKAAKPAPKKAPAEKAAPKAPAKKTTKSKPAAKPATKKETPAKAPAKKPAAKAPAKKPAASKPKKPTKSTK